MAASPHIDPEAMNEALTSNGPGSPLGSAAAYLHYLEGNLLAERGDHAGAVAAYRETLALDGGATHVRLRLALEYRRLGKTDEAEVEARTAVADDPGSAEAHELLGAFYLQGARPAAAAGELQKAVSLDPKLTEAYRSLVQARLALGDVRGSERVLDAWATASPGEGLGWREFGELMLARGDLARAEKFLDRALKYRPEDPQALAALGRLADQRGRPERAMALFERSQRADPEDPAVLFALGQHHLLRAALSNASAGELAAARGCFNSLVAMAADEAGARLQVAFAYLKAHLDADALHELDGAVAADPQNARAVLYRGEVELQLGRFEEAAKDLAGVPAEDEAYLDARAKLGLALFKLHRIGEATAVLKSGLAARPEAPQLVLELADIQRATGRGQEAVELLENAVAAGPVTGSENSYPPELVEALADAYEDVGRTRDAIALLKRTLVGKPGQERLRLALGAKLRRSGDFEGAVAAMRELLRFEPHNAEALNFIGYEYAERGIHLSEAQRLVTQALESEPKNGAYADSLGWVYFRMGKIRQAIETLQRARRFAPDEPAIAEHLGDVYQATGDPGLALESYGQALRILDAHPDPELAADLKRKLEGLKARVAAPITSNAR
jgi:tetratricopeptide (TPR) repeat protein